MKPDRSCEDPASYILLPNVARCLSLPLPKRKPLETPVAAVRELYGNQVRIRVCGICIQHDRILLVNHQLYGKDSSFWSPPGGGVNFGEAAANAVVREVQEETGLVANAIEFLFLNEFIQAPLHAIELFFKIECIEGVVSMGKDPEFDQNEQIIKEVKFLTFEELSRIPDKSKHACFSGLNNFQDLFEKKGQIFNN